MSSKAELRKTFRATIDGAVMAIGAAVDSITELDRKHALAVGVFEVRAGMGLDQIRETFATAKTSGVSFAKTKGVGTDDWRVLARETVPGKDVKTIYRWQNAGAVARVLGDDVGNALVGSLVPLYRILSAVPKSGTDEDRAAAEDLVRTAWKEALADAGTEDGVQVPPESDAVKTIAERLAPTTRSGGASASTETTDDDDDEDDDDDDETTPQASASGLVVVDPAAVEAATGPTDAILRGLVREHGISEGAARGCMLAALRLGTEHGNGNVVAALATTTKDDGGADAPKDN